MPVPKRVAVIGGGLTGVLAAAIRSAQGCQVTIVEGSTRLGGLLSSVAGEDGAWFDCGTHVPQETGVPAVDQFLFAGVDEVPWRRLGALRAGNVFRGSLNAATPFPDLNRLGPALHALAVSELLVLDSDPAPSASSGERLRRAFGPTVTREVFAPLLRKLLGHDPDALAPKAHELFVSRVVALDPATTRELKRLPHLDAVLAFHSGEESPSARRAFYPAHGGAGMWIADIEARWLGSTDRRLGAAVEAVLRDDDTITALRLSDGGLLPVDELVWTTPAIGYARAAGIALPTGLQPPALRCTQLHHLVLDRELDTDLHYFTVLDEDLELFRATLYQSLRGGGPPSCTLEVMSAAPPPDVGAQRERLLGELASLGVLRAGTRVTSSRTDLIREGFPVMTPEFLTGSQAIAEACAASAPNLRLVGRSTGRAFFMHEVLRDCYNQLADLSP